MKNQMNLVLFMLAAGCFFTVRAAQEPVGGICQEIEKMAIRADVWKDSIKEKLDLIKSRPLDGMIRMPFIPTPGWQQDPSLVALNDDCQVFIRRLDDVIEAANKKNIIDATLFELQLEADEGRADFQNLLREIQNLMPREAEKNDILRRLNASIYNRPALC